MILDCVHIYVRKYQAKDKPIEPISSLAHSAFVNLPLFPYLVNFLSIHAATANEEASRSREIEKKPARSKIAGPALARATRLIFSRFAFPVSDLSRQTTRILHALIAYSKAREVFGIENTMIARVLHTLSFIYKERFAYSRSLSH